MHEHTPEFVAVRDAIVDRLDDDDRRRLAALLGCMTDPAPEVGPALADLLGAIARLEPVDRGRLGRWCARYLTRWGQVPVAAARRVTPPPRKRPS